MTSALPSLLCGEKPDVLATDVYLEITQRLTNGSSNLGGNTAKY
jgi:hypothetical protein